MSIASVFKSLNHRFISITEAIGKSIEPCLQRNLYQTPFRENHVNRAETAVAIIRHASRCTGGWGIFSATLRLQVASAFSITWRSG